jgi:glucose-6-phosphate 1-dehydrogenase
MVEAAWRIATPILEAWRALPAPETYPAGSWGPTAADELLHQDGQHWYHAD